MSDELREKVATLFDKMWSSPDGTSPGELADAAIGLIRNETLEEAAKEFEEYAEDNRFYPPDAAATVRAMKDK